MNPTRCAYCLGPLNIGRTDSKFCTSRCKTYFHRRSIPRELTSRAKWVRHDARKVPLNARTGRAEDFTQPAAWSTYREAKSSTRGVGLGFVLSADDDICCVDLDGVLDNGVLLPAAREIIESVPDKFMVEISRSLRGVHVWARGENAPGTNRVENGIRVERYHKGRYIAVTGLRLGL